MGEGEAAAEGGRVMRPILGLALCRHLAECLGLDPESNIRRIVVDAPVDGGAVAYVEQYADERMLDVKLGPDGVEIRGVPKGGGA